MSPVISFGAGSQLTAFSVDVVAGFHTTVTHVATLPTHNFDSNRNFHFALLGVASASPEFRRRATRFLPVKCRLSLWWLFRPCSSPPLSFLLDRHISKLPVGIRCFHFSNSWSPPDTNHSQFSYSELILRVICFWLFRLDRADPNFRRSTCHPWDSLAPTSCIHPYRSIFETQVF